MEETVKLQWKTHTPNLIKEIIACSGQFAYKQPLLILYETLRQVAKRASELNDPEMNALMCRLTMYAIADPQSEFYDPEKLKEILE